MPAIGCLTAVLWWPGNGFDLTDEALSLLAADPPERGAAFNGLAGAYLRPLWTLVGWDVAGVRALGLLGLAASAALLGRATAALLDRRPALTVAVAVAASTGFYASGLRTPSYNWLAMIGAQLTCAATLRLLARWGPRWGLLAGGGLAAAATGKVTTAAALAAVFVVGAVAARRSVAVAWAGAALAVAVAVHVAFVLPAAQTVGTLRRSAAFLATLDPSHYTLAGSVHTLAGSFTALLVPVLVGGGLAGLVPLAAVVPHPQQDQWFARLCGASAVAAAVAALATGVWSGVLDRPRAVGGGVLPLLVALVLCTAIARLLPLARSPGADRGLVGAAVLAAATLSYLLGSNLRPDAVLETVTGLLGPACLLVAGSLPGRARVLAVSCTAAALIAGSLVASVQAAAAPKRQAPLAAAVVPVVLGPATVRLDPASAGQLRGLVAAAHAAGWRDGTPLVDASFTPAVALALHARVPPVLAPTVPRWPAAAVCAALKGLGSDWSAAWLVVEDPPEQDDARQVAGALGRAWPADYEPVARLVNQWMPLTVTLLRPRDGLAAGPGCLGG